MFLANTSSRIGASSQVMRHRRATSDSFSAFLPAPPAEASFRIKLTFEDAAFESDYVHLLKVAPFALAEPVSYFS